LDSHYLSTSFQDPRPQNITFFEHEFTNPGSGIIFLAAQAQTRISFIIPGQYDDNDTIAHLLLTQLCLSLSNQNKALLAQLIQHVQAQAVKIYLQSQSKTKSESFGSAPCSILQVPNTPRQLRNTVWEGKYSISDNLPHPFVERFGHYAGTSIMSCILIYIIMGTNLMQYTRINSTTIVSIILQNLHVHS
jgi:hypothetical protein